MSELKELINEQVEQIKINLDKLATAGVGLIVKVRDEADKQFSSLVQAGEGKHLFGKSETSSLAEELTNDIKAQFDDVQSSAEKFRVASLGLIVKVKESSEKYFDELVELGKKETSTKVPAEA